MFRRTGPSTPGFKHLDIIVFEYSSQSGSPGLRKVQIWMLSSLKIDEIDDFFNQNCDIPFPFLRSYKNAISASLNISRIVFLWFKFKLLYLFHGDKDVHHPITVNGFASPSKMDTILVCKIHNFKIYHVNSDIAYDSPWIQMEGTAL